MGIVRACEAAAGKGCKHMSQSREVLQVYEVGPTTVVGFGGRDILDDINVANCRDELVQLVTDHQCQVIAFDLTGVRLLPSGLLGVLASLRNLGLEVRIYNPSPDVLDVLAITKFDQIFQISNVEIAAPKSVDSDVPPDPDSNDTA